ncbi:MAG: cell surface protein SprA [Bacteroidetes bacterium]|nr:cell surface protein SprA [Bacteroidota bacterium]
MIKGVVKFLAVSSVSVGLMSVVVNSNAKPEPLSKTHPDYMLTPGTEIESPAPQHSKAAFDPYVPQTTLAADTPVTKNELYYPFNDNNGSQPMYDDQHGLYGSNPSNIKTTTEYNPQTGNYDVTQKIGDMDYRPETYVEFEDYQKDMFKQAVKKYWRSRIKAEELNQPKKGIVPKLQINNEIFDRIFGGNTVDIKPTGTAELIFGLNRNKTMNPAIPQRQQKVTNFDFNMRVQLNLIGKIGDKLKITTSYNTEASFDWENQMKLEYTGYEDEIIKKIEAGNVSLPLNSTLITGSQTLFGVKMQLQFGRLTATTIFSQQRGKKQEVSVQGGAQTQYFTVNGDNYEANKHFYLGHYFRDNYDNWMTTLPVIATPIVITKVEVYITNQTGVNDQTRNIVAFADLGEDTAHVTNELQYCQPNTSYAISPSGPLGADTTWPSNSTNNLYKIISDPSTGLLKARDGDITNLTSIATNTCNSGNYYMLPGRDYEKIQNARKLNPTEYTINNRLGFISINQTINNDQAVAVAYQYTYGGKVYQVGEFSDQFPAGSQTLFLKLLKSASVTNPHFHTWQLMMKNVYSLGAYNLNSQDFKLDVYYNNIQTGVDIPYIPYGSVNGKLLIQTLGLDKLSVNGDKYADGVFDFIQGYTINPANGRVYFSTKEPFGNNLRNKFAPDDFPGANKYVFQELYDSTRVIAQQLPEKNRYKIKGQYKSASGSEISLNALNIPQGSVSVTANGVKLTENVDYTVDYTLGRVKIINESILNSGANIKVSTESNSLFNVQQKSLFGTRLDFKVNKDLTIGGTVLHLSEKPVTQKVNIGDEPVSNTIWGTDYNYKTEAPFLTRLIDKIPLINTKEMSTITTQGEFAQLVPGNARAIGKSGNSYIDDFEGSISLIDLKSPTNWLMASIPQGQPTMFPEAIAYDDSSYNFNRAQFNWYTIDPLFYRYQDGLTPSYYKGKEIIYSNNFQRAVYETELFPGKTPPNGQPVNLPVLDLAFYPSERGPYNFEIGPTAHSKGILTNLSAPTYTDIGKLANPETRWGGIMRRLETNDFQAANIEYIQFWMMDPYNEDYKSTTYPDMDPNNKPSGDLYINLGNVSEDILKDGKMSYENGIPAQSAETQNLPVTPSKLAKVPSLPPVTNSFANDQNDRPFQDVGYDGYSDSEEQTRFSAFVNSLASYSGNSSAPNIQSVINDPCTDDYKFFRGSQYDNDQLETVRRYKKYNNPEGNSPTEGHWGESYNTSASTIPNIEDVNKDNTLNETENYYQYRVHISPTDLTPSNVGNNFIVNVIDGSAKVDNTQKNVKWYQFKIPIAEFEKSVGSIEGFNSIRFMRVFMRGFDRPIICRMARFELVRSDWRRYQYDLQKPGEYIANDDNTTTFDVSAVSVQENGQKTPVNYVIPPGIQQQQNVQTTNLVLMNEQALQLRTTNLKDGDSRAIYKNTDLDVRSFKKMKMFVHAEKLNNEPLNDGDLTLFVRLGTDYNNNYYEYEVPLHLTAPGYYDPNSDSDKGIVWPSNNEVVIDFETITGAKEARNATTGKDLVAAQKPFTLPEGSNFITIVGNPNLATIKSIMIGIRNPKDNGNMPHAAEVWVNELRLTDFNNKGGWATTGRIQAKLADFGQVALSTTYSKPFFGSIEKKISERSRETNFQWDMTSTFQLGKFFPAKWKVNMPFYYAYGQTRITPLYNPLDPDITMAAIEKTQYLSESDKRQIKHNTQDITQRRGYNFSNVRIDGLKRDGAKPMPWDLSNISFTYAYNEITRRSVNIDHSIVKQYRGSVAYNYQVTSKPWQPFKKTTSKILNNKWLALIKDINVTPLPSRFGFNMDVNRSYSELLNRDNTSFYTNDASLTTPQFNKTFTITRAYDTQWNITKNLKFDFTANNDGRILEPRNAIDTREKRDSIKDNLLKLGTNATTQYRHQMNLNYQIPINKIPIFDFINANARYSGTYTWMRRPYAAEQVGNTIQNTNTKALNGTLNMTTLYNKIPFFRKVNTTGLGGKKDDGKGGAQKGNTTGKGLETKPAANDSTKKDDKNSAKDLVELICKGIMMLKQVSVTYQEQNGVGLPGFNPSSRTLGMDRGADMAPGWQFVSGMEGDIRTRAEQKDWLVKNPNQNLPYTKTFTQNFTYRANIEPHSSLKIEVNGTYTRGRNESSYLRFDTITNRFVEDSRNLTGNYSISVFTLGQSFKDSPKGTNSKLFDEFLLIRPDIAKQLSAQNQFSSGTKTYIDEKGQLREYQDGYNNTQQDVLLGAFYKTYTGRNLKGVGTDKMFNGVPMPNYSVSWDGLGKLKAMKKLFQSITIRHAYRSTYTLGGYGNNLLYVEGQGTRSPVENPVIGGTQQSSNFNPKYTITGATISEAFSPLIKVDLKFNKPGWQGNFEVKRDKTVNLNITGPQIIETKGQEYIIGAGYKYPKLKINAIKIKGQPLQSDLNIKVDISYRRNMTVIRRIVDEISTPTSGQNIITLKSSIDYQLTQNINLRFFYDWIRTKPQTSATFPTANTNAGFSLRFNL